MQARPVQILSDARTRNRVVRVPLGPRGMKGFATIDLDCWEKFIEKGFSGNLNAHFAPNSDRLYVTAPSTAATGNNILVARVLMDAKRGEIVRYIDGDPTNLRKSNLRLEGKPFEEDEGAA